GPPAEVAAGQAPQLFVDERHHLVEGATVPALVGAQELGDVAALTHALPSTGPLPVAGMRPTHRTVPSRGVAANGPREDGNTRLADLSRRVRPSARGRSGASGCGSGDAASRGPGSRSAAPALG